jgi:L-iditol 2-dehydrogenase
MPRAAIMVGPGQPIEVQDRPSPDLEPGSILLETIYSEVCGTDVHLHHGRLAGVPYPIIPGHVSVGRVIKVAGKSVDIDGQPIHEGAIATFHDVHETCHACWYCQVARAPNRCPSRKVYGVTYGAGDGLLGGWSELIYLKPGVKVIPLPETVSPERLIAAGCGLATAIHAVDRAEIRVGDAVAIQGSGPVGLSAAILARLSGADPVVVVGDPAERLEAARAFGVDDTISVSETAPAERIEWVRELTGGRGADVTIEATGVPSAVREGFKMTRDAGRYVIVGHYTDAGDVSINPHTDINLKHLEIRGTWGADFNHFYRMVKNVEGGRVVKAVVQP